MAIMIIWSKLLPAGVADAVGGRGRNRMLIERAARAQAMLCRSGFRNILKPSKLNVFRLPSLSARDRLGDGARKQALLTKAALRLWSSMTAWIKKNPDTLPCICNSGLGFGPREKRY